MYFNFDPSDTWTVDIIVCQPPSSANALEPKYSNEAGNSSVFSEFVSSDVWNDLKNAPSSIFVRHEKSESVILLFFRTSGFAKIY